MENTENEQQTLDLEDADEVVVEETAEQQTTVEPEEESEQQEYSASVQKRINKLTHK